MNKTIELIKQVFNERDITKEDSGDNDKDLNACLEVILKIHELEYELKLKNQKINNPKNNDDNTKQEEKQPTFWKYITTEYYPCINCPNNKQPYCHCTLPYYYQYPLFPNIHYTNPYYQQPKPDFTITC